MSTGTPRCVYCSKPTRSHQVAISPTAYAAAYNDRTFDADHGTYLAAICHACWESRDEAALQELEDAPSRRTAGDDGTERTGRLSAAGREAIRDMQHEYVRFELAD